MTEHERTFRMDFTSSQPGLITENPLLILPTGEIADTPWRSDRPSVIFPGSFNPPHEGHWRLAEVAAELAGLPVEFEISRANVDKPELSEVEVARRLASFVGKAPVWITRAARFAEKAFHFPRATFLVGADTALRLVAPAYYGGDVARMMQALACLRSWECRFLVACRVDSHGKCWHLDDVPIPSAFADLFEAIPAARFRLDVSSTSLRGAP